MRRHCRSCSPLAPGPSPAGKSPSKEACSSLGRRLLHLAQGVLALPPSQPNGARCLPPAWCYPQHGATPSTVVLPSTVLPPSTVVLPSTVGPPCAVVLPCTVAHHPADFALCLCPPASWVVCHRPGLVATGQTSPRCQYHCIKCPYVAPAVGRVLSVVYQGLAATVQGSLLRELTVGGEGHRALATGGAPL